jgi:hypothetical protein
MATWKKIIVSGSNAHLAQITSSVLTSGNLVMAGVGGALQNSGFIFSGSTFNIGSNSIISTGANSVLTGSFSGSFTGHLTQVRVLFHFRFRNCKVCSFKWIQNGMVTVNSTLTTRYIVAINRC